ncbi:MAG: hypothetical protein V7K25_02605 [Nostoc sp.]
MIRDPTIRFFLVTLETTIQLNQQAITWSQERFPDSTVYYVVADLLAIPS